MNNFRLFTIFICLITHLSANSQIRKVPPQSKAVSSKEKYVLNPQDYKYYFLASRGNSGNANDTYTLKDKSASPSNLNTPLIVIDARTMKELSWWPEITVSSKKGNLYSYEIDRQGALLMKFTPTGNLVFSKYLTWKTPTGEQGKLMKSGDDKHVYTIYNNDAWIGDFDISTGINSNMHQVTQTGLMSDYGNSYMRNDILILGNYIINTRNGVYEKAEPVENYTPNDSCPFFQTNVRYGTVLMPEIHSFSEWDYKFSTRTSISDNIHYIDRNQTKMLAFRSSPNGKKSQEIMDYSKLKFTNKVTPVTWTEHVATPDGAFWGPLLELAISPKSKYLVTPGVLPETSSSVLYIYNLETLAEYYLPIKLGQYPPNETGWADDTHLIFTMRADRMDPAMLNSETRITTENQGTYILDIETKQIKRLTPYLLKDYDKTFIRLLEAKTVLFEANNYIFRCNSDGTELTQITKIPGVYNLARTFLK